MFKILNLILENNCKLIITSLFPDCGGGWFNAQYFGLNLCYKLIRQTDMTVSIARSQCIDLGGDLVCPSSRLSQSFTLDYIRYVIRITANTVSVDKLNVLKCYLAWRAYFDSQSNALIDTTVQSNSLKSMTSWTTHFCITPVLIVFVVTKEIKNWKWMY